MTSHGTRNWNDIAAAARDLADVADACTGEGAHRLRGPTERLRKLLETVDASRDEPTEADQLRRLVKLHMGAHRVSGEAFIVMGESVLRKIADGGSLGDVLEIVGDCMNERDAVDEDCEALFERAKAALHEPPKGVPLYSEDSVELLLKAQELLRALVGGRSARPAAEPPEDHGVRWVHPGCEECKQVAQVLTGWRGLAAEPTEDHGLPLPDPNAPRRTAPAYLLAWCPSCGIERTDDEVTKAGPQHLDTCPNCGSDAVPSESRDTFESTDASGAPVVWEGQTLGHAGRRRREHSFIDYLPIAPGTRVRVVAVSEARTDAAGVAAEPPEPYAATRLDALRALRREGYAVVDKAALDAARGVAAEPKEPGDGD